MKGFDHFFKLYKRVFSTNHNKKKLGLNIHISYCSKPTKDYYHQIQGQRDAFARNSEIYAIISRCNIHTNNHCNTVGGGGTIPGQPVC